MRGGKGGRRPNASVKDAPVAVQRRVSGGRGVDGRGAGCVSVRAVVLSWCIPAVVLCRGVWCIWRGGGAIFRGANSVEKTTAINACPGASGTKTGLPLSTLFTYAHAHMGGGVEWSGGGTAPTPSLLWTGRHLTPDPLAPSHRPLPGVWMGCPPVPISLLSCVGIS